LKKQLLKSLSQKPLLLKHQPLMQVSLVRKKRQPLMLLLLKRQLLSN
jgi:hypothetical protein